MMAGDGVMTRTGGIVVMGVSGVGKSTLGALLARELDVPFLEGDDFHSAAAVAKMHAGHPLCDDDRWPWLDRLGAALGAAVRERGGAVAACSALKVAYRARLARAAGMPLRFVLPDTDAGAIARRMTARHDHYMPTSLLASQLATLERPTAAERALVVDAGRPPQMVCRDVRAWLDLR